MTAEESVQQIANDAAEETAQSDLPAEPGGLKLVAPPPERGEGDACDSGEDSIVAVKLAPSRAGVPPVNPTEKAGKDLQLIPVIEGPNHPPLGELVESQHARCYGQDASFGRPAKPTICHGRSMADGADLEKLV